MILDHLKRGNKVSDEEFDTLFSDRIRDQSADHYTPVEVAKAAAHYLAANRATEILDIGAGVGKFCLIGAITTPAMYTGVEQTAELVDSGNQLIAQFNLDRIRLIHADIVEIDFSVFEAFYFYNTFHHLISEMSTTPADRLRYRENSAYVATQLQRLPVGTRLATYYSLLKEVPSSYLLQSSKFSNKLKFWKKIK